MKLDKLCLCGLSAVLCNFCLTFCVNFEFWVVTVFMCGLVFESSVCLQKLYCTCIVREQQSVDVAAPPDKRRTMTGNKIQASKVKSETSIRPTTLLSTLSTHHCQRFHFGRHTVLEFEIRETILDRTDWFCVPLCYVALTLLFTSKLSNHRVHQFTNTAFWNANGQWTASVPILQTRSSK